MNYAQGFSDGERQATKDRANGTRQTFAEPRNEYEAGRRDGYTPRSPTWWAPCPVEFPWAAKQSLCDA